eukprot:scaffold1741_cov262-Pinguiococcus_pyrenoidosus.AAC.45
MRVHHVANALGHLSPICSRDEAVGKDRFGQIEVRGHQHAGPNHRVKPDDVLADDMHVSRPARVLTKLATLLFDSSEIVRQCVEPDVHHMVGLEALRDGNAPVKGGARDA